MTSPSMQDLGQILSAHKVREVFFVHGTFVGNDPLDIFNTPIPSSSLGEGAQKIANALLGGTLSSDLIDTFKKEIKKAIDRTSGDVGNFTTEYVRKFGQALENGICEDTKPFSWGGGNSHKARLQGTVELAATIAQSITNKSIQADDRILLIGHSHAGQLFFFIDNFS